MPEPLVSILITNYNYGQYLHAAIESALAQTYRLVEVIVVDDGSTDESRDVIASFGNRVVGVLKVNAGQNSAFNAGFCVSRGDIICLLDSDDWFLSEKTDKVVEAFAHGQYGWFFHLLSSTGGIEAPPDPGFRAGDWDYRAQMAAGNGFPYVPTATSGLCFRRELFARLLPMPEQIRIPSDHYMKWAALSLEPGLFSASQLAVQRIHGTNIYTGSPAATPLRSEVLLATTSHLQNRYPGLGAFCARLGSTAIANLGTKVIYNRKYRMMAAEFLGHFPIHTRIRLLARAGINYIRNELRRLGVRRPRFLTRTARLR